MPPPERILLIRPSALGDVCRSVHLLAHLRLAYPDARIDWLVRDGFREAIEYHPALTGVVPFERSRLGHDMKRGRPGSTIAFLRALRRERYDLVIDAQGLFRSGLFAFATGAPKRIGHRRAAESARMFYTQTVDTPLEAHTVDRMAALLGPLGIESTFDLRLTPPPAARERLAHDDPLGAPGLRYAVFAPTSRWASKRWPIERFDRLCEALLAARGGPDAVVCVGAPSERDQCAPLLARSASDGRVIDRVGATGVGDLMALIERAALVVANDSAALHMAVGLARPAVALFGPTRVDRVGPYGRGRDVLQHLRPGDTLDHKDDRNATLMERISVDEVLEACLARLAGPVPVQ